MPDEYVLSQVVSNFGKEISKVTAAGAESTVKARVTTEQVGTGAVSWKNETGLDMDNRILTLTEEAEIDESHTFKFEGKEWWPAEIQRVQDRKGGLSGYRVLAFDTGSERAALLSDGTDEVEVVSDDLGESPGELKRGDISIPGADENNIQDLGKANDTKTLTIQLGSWTGLNGDRAGSPQVIWYILERWHEGQTTLQYTDTGSPVDVKLEIKNFQSFDNAEIILAEVEMLKV